MSSSQYAYRNPRSHGHASDPISHGSIEPPSLGLLVAYVFLFGLAAYGLLRQQGLIPPHAISYLLWSVLVYVTPPRLVLALETKQDPASVHDMGTYAASRTFGAKSEALRLIAERYCAPVLARVPWARRFSVSGALATGQTARTAGALPGLGNLDNSCYQNSVLQGLAALPSVAAFLADALGDGADGGDPRSTTWALRGMIEQLNDPANAGRRLWTPRALKSMSSWQQQDAQEYYSKILEALEQDAARSSATRADAGRGLVAFKTLRGTPGPTLQTDGSADASVHAPPSPPPSLSSSSSHPALRNPLEGLLAQRVGCLACGLVEGISLIPFNCLTLPLGAGPRYALADRLDEFAALEPINDVECAHCTLRRQEGRLARLLHQPSPTPSNGEDDGAVDDAGADAGRAAMLAMARARLAAVRAALAARDVSEATLTQKCGIGPKGRATSTKTRQAVVARAPAALALHVQRSVYDEVSGAQRKNYAAVRFPLALDLGPWCVAGGRWEVDPAVSMLRADGEAGGAEREVWYDLRAVVAHYGRHETGHYVAYRPDPTAGAERRWWRLSDANVAPVDEAFVLAQGGAFLLFYERRPACACPASDAGGSVGAVDVATEEPRAAATATATPTETETSDSDDAMDTADATAVPELTSTSPLRTPAESGSSDALPTPPASPSGKATTAPSLASDGAIPSRDSEDEPRPATPATPPLSARPSTPPDGAAGSAPVPAHLRAGSATVPNASERPASACGPAASTTELETASLVAAT